MVYRKLQKFIILLSGAGAMVLAGISCTAYRTVQVEVLEPASILVDNTKKVALYDRYVRNEGSELRVEEEEDEHHLLREFANGLNYRLSTRGKETVILLTNHNKTLLKDGESPSCLPNDTLDSLYRNAGVDYLLSVEMISYKMLQEDIHCYWMMRLYQQGANVPLDSVVIEKSFLLDTEDSDAILSELAAAFWEGGFAYGRRIIPSWVKTERRVYNRGRILGVGDAYMESDQMEKAVELWGRMAGMQNKKAVQANMNLAWVNEYMGDYIQAQYYLSEAQKLARKIKTDHHLVKYIEKYKKILEERIAKEAILETQINLAD